MTKITITVDRPKGKVTESLIFSAIKGTRSGPEIGLIHIDETYSELEIKGKTKADAWGVFYDIRNAYPAAFYKVVEKAGRKISEYPAPEPEVMA
jgi:hypothetical protein